MVKMGIGFWGLSILFLVSGLSAREADEFSVKRKNVFAFTQQPTVQAHATGLNISFGSKAFCDATVVIEDKEGRIIRHLASGVLGPNAPEPFQKNALKQTVFWDGKDDQGAYVTQSRDHTVRVSLGLKPQFERTLYWLPKKRLNSAIAPMRAAPEGVYVSESWGVDQIRLFDHSGDYLRTVYPFPHEKLKDIKDLNWIDYPQGDRLPLKNSLNQQTLLSSGDNAQTGGMGGRAATAMAVQKDRIALANLSLNRLGADGSTGGLPLKGPEVFFMYQAHGTNADRKVRKVGPTSAAFSPDGKWVYLTGYIWRTTWSFDALHGVVRIPFQGTGEKTIFTGSMKQDDSGSKPGQFNGATSVAVDRKGRVYVSDFVNDRIQIFSSEGTFLKAVPTFRPAQIEIHPKTQELYVFSWPVYTRGQVKSKVQISPALFHYGPFEDPKPKAKYPLPLPLYKGAHMEWWNMPPLSYRAALDGYTDPPTIWLCGGAEASPKPQPWESFHIRLLQVKNGKLEVVRSFGAEAQKDAGRPKGPIWNIQHQRLYVNPKSGKLLFGEPDSGPANKAFNQLVEIDPESGALKLVDLPFNAEDIAFDVNGLIYLRTTDVVGRFDPLTWREVPWDYGEELSKVGCFMGGRGAPLIAGLVLPSKSPVCFHQGGMAVSVKGHLAVSCANKKVGKFKFKMEKMVWNAKPYQPKVYPGRLQWGEVHVWDKHGKMLYEDAIPGLNQIDGLGIDKDDNLYAMTTATRMLDGKKYPNKMTETLVKVAPGKSKFLSSSRNAAVPLADAARPGRAADLYGGMLGQAWAKGAKWFYGGVGYAGFNVGTHCACWHARFSLDYLGRSFAPEVDRFQVAVLDSNGNLILRIGRYGNVDDGKPLVLQGGPKQPRSIGGDEVALFHAAFAATHTDKRLFVADIGNARIVSIKLGYHVNERIPLKNHPDLGTKLED